jgi:hypothetical protein
LKRILLQFFDAPTDRLCGGVLFFLNPMLVVTCLAYTASNFFVFVLGVRRFRKEANATLRPFSAATTPSNPL